MGRASPSHRDVESSAKPSGRGFDGEPIKVARVAPPSGTVQWWDAGAPAQEAEVSSPAS